VATSWAVRAASGLPVSLPKLASASDGSTMAPTVRPPQLAAATSRAIRVAMTKRMNTALAAYREV
jgi:hypothetical protein